MDGKTRVSLVFFYDCNHIDVITGIIRVILELIESREQLFKRLEV